MISPGTLTTTVLKVVRETADTVTIRLGLDGQPFEFRAGMAVSIAPHQFPRLADRIAALEKDKAKPERPRDFSLASSPLEKEFVEITVKEEAPGAPRPLLSPYFVHELRPGDKVTIQGPFGLFVLPEPLDPADRGIVYVSAGSGAAPNRGILKHCLAAGLALRHLFIVQNKTARDVIYASELEGIAALNEGTVRVVNVLSRERVDGMEHGYITRELLERELKNFEPPERTMAFVCGPNRPRPGHAEGFVDRFAGNRKKGVRGLLAECGIPEKRIVRETW